MSRIVALRPLQPGAGVREVELPFGAHVVGITKKQTNEICVICEIDPKETRTEVHAFAQVLNGQPVPPGDYLGTVEIEEKLQQIPRGVIVPPGFDPNNLMQVMWVHVYYLYDGDDNDGESVDSPAADGSTRLLGSEDSERDNGPRRMSA